MTHLRSLVLLLLIVGCPVELAQAATGVPVPIAPLGTTLSAGASPTFQWQYSSDAQWYHLWITNYSTMTSTEHWFDAWNVCTGGVCSFTDTSVYPSGAYAWWLQAWSSSGGYSAWTNTLMFGVAYSSAPVPIMPSGIYNSATHEPYFYWLPLPGAEWYQVWIAEPGGGGGGYWFNAAAICTTNYCGTTAITVGGGVYTWWVQGWNSQAGYSPWSAGLWFSEGLDAPVPLSPIGTTLDTSPTFVWERDPDVYWYYLWVSRERTGKLIDQWYNAFDICDVDTCSVTPPLNLNAWVYSWWVQGWNPLVGYGDWSAQADFAISDGGIDGVVTDSQWEPNPSAVNSPATFRVSFYNGGFVTATNVVIDTDLETLFSAAEIGSWQHWNSGSGTFDETTGIWNITTMPPGTFGRLLVTVTPTAAGTYTVESHIASMDQADTDSSNNQTTSIPLNVLSTVDMQLGASWNLGSVVPGTNTTFTVRAHNHSPVTATNVQIDTNLETLPLTYVSSSDVNYNPATGVWTLPALNGFAYATLNVTLTTTTEGSYQASAAVTHVDQVDSNSTNDTAQATLNVSSATDVGFDTTWSAWTWNPITLGGYTYLRIRVANYGLVGATNIVIDTHLDEGFTPAELDDLVLSGGTWDETTGLWQINSLPSWQITSLDLTVRPAHSGMYSSLTPEILSYDQTDTAAWNNTGFIPELTVTAP